MAEYQIASNWNLENISSITVIPLAPKFSQQKSNNKLQLNNFFTLKLFFIIIFWIGIINIFLVKSPSVKKEFIPLETQNVTENNNVVIHNPLSTEITAIKSIDNKPTQIEQKKEKKPTHSIINLTNQKIIETPVLNPEENSNASKELSSLNGL